MLLRTLAILAIPLALYGVIATLRPASPKAMPPEPVPVAVTRTYEPPQISVESKSLTSPKSDKPRRRKRKRTESNPRPVDASRPRPQAQPAIPTVSAAERKVESLASTSEG